VNSKPGVSVSPNPAINAHIPSDTRPGSGLADMWRESAFPNGRSLLQPLPDSDKGESGRKSKPSQGMFRCRHEAQHRVNASGASQYQPSIAHASGSPADQPCASDPVVSTRINAANLPQHRRISEIDRRRSLICEIATPLLQSLAISSSFCSLVVATKM
jgi:hypothetical protein